MMGDRSLTGPRPRPPRVWAAALVLAGCRALLGLPPVGEELSEADGGPTSSVPTNEAGPAAETGPVGPTCATVSLPPEGDYIYTPVNPARKGEEQLFILNSDGTENGPFGGITTIPEGTNTSFLARVTHQNDHTYLSQFFLNGNHTDEYTFNASPNSGLQVVNVKQRQLGDGFIVNAKCDPPVDVIKCAMTPNQAWRAGPKGTFIFNGNEGSFNTTIDFQYVVDDDAGLASQLSVDGKLVDTYHIKETRSLNGNLYGTQLAEYWFSRQNGLLIRASFTTGDITSKKTDGITLRLGELLFEFKGHAEFVLSSLDPKPLPDAGPPADSGVKDANTKDAKDAN